MNKEIIKLREKAENMIGNMSIKNGESEIIKTLIDISQTDGKNKDYEEKTLACIERYLLAKEKMNILENDLKFLHKISEDLKEQEIRITDVVDTPLFKVINKDGNEKYFITRSSAESYIKMDRCNCKGNYKKIVQLVTNENMELEKLLEIVKRNF